MYHVHAWYIRSPVTISTGDCELPFECWGHVLETEPEFFVRAISVLIVLTVFPAPPFWSFIYLFTYSLIYSFLK